jgi:hypothetical protein
MHKGENYVVSGIEKIQIGQIDEQRYLLDFTLAQQAQRRVRICAHAQKMHRQIQAQTRKYYGLGFFTVAAICKGACKQHASG